MKKGSRLGTPVHVHAELGKYALWLLPACSNSSAGSGELSNGSHSVNKRDAFLPLVFYCPSPILATTVDFTLGIPRSHRCCR